MKRGDGRHDAELRDHWAWRRGWRAGRRSWTFHVTFGDDVATAGGDGLRAAAAAWQGRLRGVAGLEPVPARWLHLTLQKIGFVDEVAEVEVEAVLAAARERCRRLAPFRLEVGAPIVAAEAVLLPAGPMAPVRALRDAIRAAIAEVRGAGAVAGGDGIQPHVSIAYAHAPGPAAEAIAALDGAAPPPVEVTLNAASLIVLERDHREYRWRHHATLPLGGER